MNPAYFMISIYLLALTVCLLALLKRGKYERAVKAIEGGFSTLSSRHLMATFALFLGMILLRTALLPLLPVPTPEVHDEFSFLLLGDTIAHGRLTNPTPPLYQSFETFHENMYPTYCSKYAPGMGFWLALGQKLGNSWIGVLFITALMVAAFFWSLRDGHFSLPFSSRSNSA